MGGHGEGETRGLSNSECRLRLFAGRQGMRNLKGYMRRWGDAERNKDWEIRRAKAGYQWIRIPGNQDIRDRRREIKEVSPHFKIFLLILTMAWVGGTCLGQTLTHWKTVLHPQTPF